MAKMERRVIKEMVGLAGQTAAGGLGVIVEIVDEGAGEFVRLTDMSDSTGQVSFDPEFWPLLRAVIDDAVGRCRE
jgi:hypothetical protein